MNVVNVFIKMNLLLKSEVTLRTRESSFIGVSQLMTLQVREGTCAISTVWYGTQVRPILYNNIRLMIRRLRKMYRIKMINFSSILEWELSSYSILVLGQIHICLRISDPDLSTRICRFYDYMPRATDPDMNPQIWELFISFQSIQYQTYKFWSSPVEVHITPKNLTLPRYISFRHCQGGEGEATEI